MPNGDTVSDLIRILEQTNLADRPGRLLYSGLGTLCPGRLYMLGDNPGGDPDAESDSPRTHLEALVRRSPDWNEYISGVWKPRGRVCAAGEAGMQRRVRDLLTNLGLPTQTVCASNLIFVRSQVSDGLGNRLERAHLARQCWPVPQDSPHSQTAPKVSAKTRCSASIAATRWTSGASRCSGMFGMRS